MTVNTISSVAEFETNGVTTNYPFYFKFLANEDLVVTYINPVGASTTLTLGTHYTVNGAGNDAGGSIITVTALAGPGQLVVSREMDAFQQTSLRNQGKFLAETHEDVFDRLTMLIQQGFAIFTRALTRPFGRDYFFAENRRITSVKDPVDDQDAATKHSVQAYVASVLEAGQGPINNAANVAYVYPDGVVRSVQSLATKNNPLLGAAGIAHLDGTVAQSLQTIPFGYEHTPAAKPWGSGSITDYAQLVVYSGIYYKYIGATLPKSISGTFENEPANSWIRIGSDISAYRPTATKTLDISSKLASGFKVVITGDSLPFNAFEFPSSVPLLPADYAYKNPYGLSAWGHMIRDTIYSSGYDFTLAKNAQIILSPGIQKFSNVNNVYTAPFNNQMDTYLVDSALEQISIRMNGVFSSSSVRLMFFTGNSDFTNIAKFDIYTAGVLRRSVDLRGDMSLYTGRYQLNVDNIPMSGDTDITIRNIVRADGAPGIAALQFIGYTTFQPSVYMTAHGSWTSAQVLSDFTNMVGQHSPDLVFYQIGANDIGLGVSVSSFKTNVENFIKNVRALKPGADVVLVSTTPTDVLPNRWGGARSYIDAMYQLAVKYQCYFVDLYDVFGTVDPLLWRHDNVHTTISGGNYVYKKIRSLLFPEISIASGYVPDARYQVVTGVSEYKANPNTITFSFDGSGNVVISASDAKYISINVSADGKVTITPSASMRISDAYVLVAPPAHYYIARPSAVGFVGDFTYSVINVLNNPPAVITAKAQLAGVYMVVVFG